MSVMDKYGEAVHPDDYVPPTLTDFQTIGLAVMHEPDLSQAEAQRLLNLLLDVFDAAGADQ